MKNFLTLWRKELAAYFLSPIAYVVTIFFLVVMGFSFWLLANVLTQESGGAAVMKELFGSIFFWLAILVVIPLLTMRLFAEERRTGTIETLMTAPVTDTAVVLAKFAGALTFYMIMWLPTLSYVYVLKAFSSMTTPLDLGPVFGGYLGAFLLGAFYLAIGLFCSALTRSQIVAGIACFAIICISFFVGFLPYISTSELMRSAGFYVSSVAHMLDFSRGTVDTRPVLLYLSGCALMLFATVKVIEARKWI